MTARASDFVVHVITPNRWHQITTRTWHKRTEDRWMADITSGPGGFTWVITDPQENSSRSKRRCSTLIGAKILAWTELQQQRAHANAAKSRHAWERAS